MSPPAGGADSYIEAWVKGWRETAPLTSDQPYPDKPMPPGATCNTCRHVQRCSDAGMVRTALPQCAFNPARYWPVARD